MGKASPLEHHLALNHATDHCVVLTTLTVNLGDHYQLLADYRSYVDTQDEVDRLYQRPDEWTRGAALNIASMGYFSSDHKIREYAEEIWKLAPVRL